MSRLLSTPDGGKTWQPSQSLRMTPGGADIGQNDRSLSGKITLGATGVGRDLGVVTTGKVWLVIDLWFQMDASTCEVQLTVNGMPVWIGLCSTTPIFQARARPIVIPGGGDVDLVCGTPGAGTPNCYFNLGILEQ